MHTHSRLGENCQGVEPQLFLTPSWPFQQHRGVDVNPQFSPSVCIAHRYKRIIELLNYANTEVIAVPFMGFRCALVWRNIIPSVSLYMGMSSLRVAAPSVWTIYHDIYATMTLVVNNSLAICSHAGLFVRGVFENVCLKVRYMNELTYLLTYFLDALVLRGALYHPYTRIAIA